MRRLITFVIPAKAGIQGKIVLVIAGRS